MDDLKIIKKWDKISQKPKWKYIIFNVALFRFALLIILILLLNEVIIFDKITSNLPKWIYTAIFKVVLSILLGIYVGHLEWNFIRKLANREFEFKKSIRQNFVLIYGFLSFGFMIAIALLNLPFKFPATIINFAIYILSGFPFGYFMYFINEYGYSKYCKL